jgi:hypothetical protein
VARRGKVHLISGGDPVRDSAELISSPRMAELAAEMKARYSDRYIFFDLPPLLAEADALAFAPLVDCILMVVHPGTSFDEIQRPLPWFPRRSSWALCSTASIHRTTTTTSAGVVWKESDGYVSKCPELGVLFSLLF